MVDEHGNIIPESAVAPEHPDAEGANPDTKGNVKPGTEVPRAEVSLDDSREEQLRMAKPASDASEATK